NNNNDSNIEINDMEEKDIVEMKRVNTNLSRMSTKAIDSSERRKSYQVRAMFRKTLSYQKRQMKTNICIACPTLMIIAAFLLSLLVENILKNIIKPEKYEFCTKEFNGQFVLSNLNIEYKKDDPDVQIRHYIGGLYSTSACSNWFGTNDYFASAPYDIVPDNNNENINHDTLFVPSLDKSGNYAYLLNLMEKVSKISEGMGGMGNLGNFGKKMKKLSKREEKFNFSGFGREASYIEYLVTNMMRPYGFVAYNKGNNTEKALIGERLQGPENITLVELQGDQHVLSNKGYLDYTSTRYVMNMDEMMSGGNPSLTFERSPYFEVMGVENGEQIDDIIINRINLIDKLISNTTFSEYTEEERKLVDISKFRDTEDAIKKSVDYMPYGVLYYKDLDEKAL
ncbi:hypothetical protein BCR36DRAFT_238746, partial [Piromyces finnis]